jgi:hypothetical protein
LRAREGNSRLRGSMREDYSNNYSRRERGGRRGGLRTEGIRLKLLGSLQDCKGNNKGRKITRLRGGKY